MNIAHRLYSDFMLPDRYDEYRQLLSKAQENGYEILSIERMWRLIKDERIARDGKYLILRHDIDTDPDGAHEFHRIEAEKGVTASYYFRLSTVDIPLMKKIAAQGGEASYHFEELATYCKANRIRDAGEIRRCMPDIEAMFAGNWRELRRKTGLPLSIVASHGDWVNRRLGVANTMVLANVELRKRLGIELEVYDDVFMRHVTRRYSDQGYPAFWSPGTVMSALELESPIVYVLTHTRHWRANLAANVSENWARLIETMRYQMSW